MKHSLHLILFFLNSSEQKECTVRAWKTGGEKSDLSFRFVLPPIAKVFLALILFCFISSFYLLCFCFCFFHSDSFFSILSTTYSPRAGCNPKNGSGTVCNTLRVQCVRTASDSECNCKIQKKGNRMKWIIGVDKAEKNSVEK